MLGRMGMRRGDLPVALGGFKKGGQNLTIQTQHLKLPILSFVSGACPPKPWRRRMSFVVTKTKRTQNVIPNACEGSVKIGSFLNFDICSLIFDMILYKQTQFLK
jgi:hypothetical protein